jgi:hypothetical protein
MSFYSRVLTAICAALLCAGVASPRAAVGSGLPFLLDLHGVATLVRYVPGGLDRAAHVQLRFELLIDGFGGWTGYRHRQSLFVLDRESWEGLETPVPYGLPVELGGGVAMAAAGDDGTVELWTGLVGDALPTTAGGAGTSLRSSASEVGSLALHDLAAEVEVSRLLVRQSGWVGEVGWIDELIAHVVARTAFLKHEAGRMPEIDQVFDRLAEQRSGPLPQTVTGRPAEPSLEVRAARAGRYAAGARIVVDKDGTASVKRLYKLSRKGKEPLTERALLERYPELADWHRAAFAP